MSHDLTKTIGRHAEDFRGEVLRSRSVPGFRVTALRHRKPSKSESHPHRLAYFSCLTSGSYVERDGSGEVDYSAGAVRFHPAGFRHGDEIGRAGARFLCVEIDGEIRPSFPGRYLSRPSFWAPSSEVARLTAAMARELRAGDAGCDFVLEGLALQLLGTVARLPVEDRVPRWLARVEERLHEEIARPLRIVDLAAEAGVHPVHLARAYRKHFCRTIGEDLRRRRVEAVRQALRSGETSLVSAASDAGFSDQSHMSRVFRRVTGMSPGQYRREVAQRSREVRFRPKG